MKQIVISSSNTLDNNPRPMGCYKVGFVSNQKSVLALTDQKLARSE